MFPDTAYVTVYCSICHHSFILLASSRHIHIINTIPGYDTAYVFFYGAYDVELACSEVFSGQSCGNGNDTAFIYDSGYDGQPEVFYQRI